MLFLLRSIILRRQSSWSGVSLKKSLRVIYRYKMDILSSLLDALFRFSSYFNTIYMYKRNIARLQGGQFSSNIDQYLYIKFKVNKNPGCHWHPRKHPTIDFEMNDLEISIYVDNRTSPPQFMYICWINIQKWLRNICIAVFVMI